MPAAKKRPSLKAQSANPEYIRLRGVRQNNLKGFDLDLPLGKYIVVTGLSGSGKSSLVFDTLHAEGQRRYVETFSAYTRQFLDLLEKPHVDSIENIRPSIAIEQTNTVKTSRSTVGTMTELCDFFKVWFAQVAQLIDPETGRPIRDDNPQSIWRDALKNHRDQTALIAFSVSRPENIKWTEIIRSLKTQGYSRVYRSGSRITKLDDLELAPKDTVPLLVIQDRVTLETAQRQRFIESAETALHFGQEELQLLAEDGTLLDRYSRGLHSPETGRRFRPATPGLFSFNSPIGACPACRGFGRVIEIDYRLVIPDRSLSIEDGAIRAFEGEVYGESKRDLIRAARKRRLRTDVPISNLSKADMDFVFNGDEQFQADKAAGREYDYESGIWYGLRGFFDWLESNTYKMHVRVFLSRFRAYTTCPECGGARLRPDALNWKWQGSTLPELYQLPVSELLQKMDAPNAAPSARNHQGELALDGIRTRLRYLDQVGLGYLTLDRSSRSLSGGEVERVNLTSCLGTSLVDTLFVLDEPSVGLHPRDIDRLITIIRGLTDSGNTVVVVEHDEAMIRAADYAIEVGPEPGRRGGNIVFQGPSDQMLASPDSITGSYLSGKLTIAAPEIRRPVDRDDPTATVTFKGVTKHNLQAMDFRFPKDRFVCLTGVSGSGKSTLLDNVIFQGLRRHKGELPEDPAKIHTIQGDLSFAEIVLVDQSPISRTPRSNPALFTDAWTPIRELFAHTPAAASQGFTASSFSFNAGDGRCDHCKGLGYERVEMQFLSDVFIPCPTCEGKRFKPEILAIEWNGHSIADILGMDVSEAVALFADEKKIHRRLQSLMDVGLGYLTLGQPLNTLSGGESQRLKLVKYLADVSGDDSHGSLLLLDEPTTGLHRHDVNRLISVLQRLVSSGHSLIVIEHNLDVIKSADWLIEIGPEAGAGGGRVVAEGPPEDLIDSDTATAPYLRAVLAGEQPTALQAAESPADYSTNGHRTATALEVTGARENNLKNLSVSIPHRQISVVTGVSGSGKSTLAFDIVFGEGQRRFMESMSPYARQFVEQLPKPDIDQLAGIPPTVAIEQRITRGSRKSTVATITEVAQYLRLLYARVGIQHHPVTGKPVLPQTPTQLVRLLEKTLAEPYLKNARHLFLCAPMIRGRKGHHQPAANWILDHGYERMRVDGKVILTESFQKLDRYREHDIEIVVADLKSKVSASSKSIRSSLEDACRLGKGSCLLVRQDGSVVRWFSTTRTDAETGDAFPELDPKHFSFNSSKGWCPTCRGHGRIFPWMLDQPDEDLPEALVDLARDTDPSDYGEIAGTPCPECSGDRLNQISRAVRIPVRRRDPISLPEILRLTPSELIDLLPKLSLDTRAKIIATDIFPQIVERLRFMGRVGLGYLTLDRPADTLSGGEAQRIRLASQLGSNLAGVLYVLDEPSIGLHSRDTDRLIDTLGSLRDKGNTLLVVEHDESVMRHADRIIDLGPGAGIHGGSLLANGTLAELAKNPDSLTGRYLEKRISHPLNGSLRTLPARKTSARASASDWITLENAVFRNLKNVDLRIPLGRLTMVAGVSGAGKSTLVRDLLRPAVAIAIREQKTTLTGKQFLKNAGGVFHPDYGAATGKPPPPFTKLVNGHRFKTVIEVDQSPIGKTPRSTPATYLGAFDTIRQFFASLPESRIRGYKPGRFSFNTPGGRCETCSGAGRVKLEMNFLPDTYLPCEDCGGTRFGPELRDIVWKGKNIGEVLALTFEEAAEFFDFHEHLHDTMQLMVDTGLGYLTLGQSSPTLSGGEAQRLKLVTELARGLPSYREKARGRPLEPNLYILEEPTIGLHLSDCEKLIRVLQRLVDQGHTVIVIEHHLDLLAEADYLVEVGPDGGPGGGKIVYQGTLSGIRRARSSPTAPYLIEHLGSR